MVRSESGRPEASSPSCVASVDCVSAASLISSAAGFYFASGNRVDVVRLLRDAQDIAAVLADHRPGVAIGSGRLVRRYHDRSEARPRTVASSIHRRSGARSWSGSLGRRVGKPSIRLRTGDSRAACPSDSSFPISAITGVRRPPSNDVIDVWRVLHAKRDIPWEIAGDEVRHH